MFSSEDRDIFKDPDIQGDSLFTLFQSHLGFG